MKYTVKDQMDIISKGTVDLLPEDEFSEKLKESVRLQKPLRVKLGCDPSKPDLHIGHAVVLHKMREFQDLGHTAILIIGDFTAMIGDPTGKNKTRPQLTMEETKINGQTYIEQATKILSEERLEIRYNSEWLSKMNFQNVIHLAANYTVAQLLERDDFSKRYRSGIPISVHELLYPLAQAMDSVAIESDIELGGTDQKFNLLVGREIQKNHGLSPQCILTMPILEGTDGVEKMSKSLNNYIAMTDTPREIFGKAMSIPDELIVRYYKYGGWASDKEVKAMDKGLKNSTLHPREAKVRMAQSIVELYHNKQAAEDAFAEFERMFVKKETPDDIEERTISSDSYSILVADVLVNTKMVQSKKEARRMIDQGAVSVDDKKIEDAFAELDFSDFRIIKVGKRKYLKVKVG